MHNGVDSIQEDFIQEIVADFKETNFYSDDFINDLEKGLRKSSYFKNKLRR